MKLKQCLATFALAALAACSQTPPEQQLLNDAAAALGDNAQIQALTSVVMEGEATQYNLGQDVRPDAIGQTFTLTDYRRVIDVANGRLRTEMTRTPNFAFFQGPAPQRLVQGVDGQVGYNVAANGNVQRIPDPAATDRRAEILHHPLTALNAALDAAAQRANLRTEGNETLLDVTTAGGESFTLAVDSTSRLPTRVITRSYNTNLGDVAIETTFDGYQDMGGWQLPARLTTRTDEFTTAEVRLTGQTVNAAVDDIAAPVEATEAPAVAGPPPANVTVEQLAPGIWLLAGQSHHSVLVEFADHAKLIEAPQNEIRTLGVIARAREVLPNKPITHLVNSHHHFDHSGGIRAAISEGLTIVTHEGNAAFYRAVAERPHTLSPDALARNPQPASVEGVSAMQEYRDDSMTMQLYPVTSEHSETMLFAYFPQSRILVQADLYTPGGAAMRFAPKFLADIRALNLSVDRMVPLHGTPVPFAQFVQDATAAAAAN